MERKGLKEHIESGDYFKGAREWYNYKYLLPFTHKVWLSYATMLLVLMLLALTININKLLPIKQKLTYAINVSTNIGVGEANARIEDMRGEAKITPTRFIASNLLGSYVMNRENFNYSNLSKQFQYMQNTSTRLVYRRFYNYMSVNNPDSPVMRYQQYAKRNITISKIDFVSDNEAIVYFNSIAKDSSGEMFENLNWSAKITFEMGEFGKRLPTGSQFKFTVNDYNLKLLGEAK
jgi:type IV secretion system protein VirB8